MDLKRKRVIADDWRQFWHGGGKVYQLHEGGFKPHIIHNSIESTLSHLPAQVSCITPTHVSCMIPTQVSCIFAPLIYVFAHTISVCSPKVNQGCQPWKCSEKKCTSMYKILTKKACCGPARAAIGLHSINYGKSRMAFWLYDAYQGGVLRTKVGNRRAAPCKNLENFGTSTKSPLLRSSCKWFGMSAADFMVVFVSFIRHLNQGLATARFSCYWM